MKRLLLGAFVLAVITPASAQASCGMNCMNSRIRSLQVQVASLQGQVVRLERTVSSIGSYTAKLENCIHEAPVTDYGDGSTGTFGYVYDTGGGNYFDTTALDETAVGDPVSGWVLLDGCNSQTVGTSRAGALATAGSLGRDAFLHSFSRRF
jgi:outer membrane murein-binding lipoprotein Lpp